GAGSLGAAPAQPVAKPTGGLDGLRAELSPDIVNMHAERIAADFLTEAIQALIERVGGYPAPIGGRQVNQQIDLPARQGDRLATQPGETAVRLQAQRSGLDGLDSPALGAPDQRVQPSGELAQVEGFDQIVIGTALQAGEPVLNGIPCRQYQYRKLGLETTHPGHQFQTFEVG